MREASGGSGKPVLIIGTGVATTQALHAAEMLAAEDIPCHVLHMHTVKPLDVPALQKFAKGARLVVTVEEHTVIGGLGSAVTDALVAHMDGNVPAHAQARDS